MTIDIAKVRSFAVVVLCATAVPVISQVKVVDSRPSDQTVSSAGNVSAQMFNRMQQLEQEVLELRGLVEQQSFEIRRLKQQRLEDYTDLDQRLSSLTKAGGSSVSTPPEARPPSSSRQSTPSSQAAKKPISERELYSDALNLLLQEKDFDGSAAKLDRYLQLFPNGLFAPNAFYWLGEISLSKQQLDESKDWFSRLLAEYPGHNKAPDAKFKLGKLYFQMGDKANAKALLSEVAQGGTPAAQLAKDFMIVNSL